MIVSLHWDSKSTQTENSSSFNRTLSLLQDSLKSQGFLKRGFERWHVVMDKMLQCSSSQHPLSNWLTDPLLSASGWLLYFRWPSKFCELSEPIEYIEFRDGATYFMVDWLCDNPQEGLSSAASLQAKSKHMKYEFEFKPWTKDKFLS